MPPPPRTTRTTPRPYRQRARARSAEATRTRVLDAAVELVAADPARPPGLGAVADRAGTTVPTVLRHFASRDALLAAALGAAVARVRAARPRIPAGHAAAAARALGGEHERHAGLLRAADALPAAAGRALEPAHRLHRDWLARTFAPTLTPLAPLVHRRRLAQLVVLGGPAAWRTMRDAERLSPEQAQAALTELLTALA